MRSAEQLEEIFMWLHAAGVEVFGDKPGEMDADRLDDDDLTTTMTTTMRLI